MKQGTRLVQRLIRLIEFSGIMLKLPTRLQVQMRIQHMYEDFKIQKTVYTAKIFERQ
jgi:hypothetical protein